MTKGCRNQPEWAPTGRIWGHVASKEITDSNSLIKLGTYDYKLIKINKWNIKSLLRNKIFTELQYLPVPHPKISLMRTSWKHNFTEKKLTDTTLINLTSSIWHKSKPRVTWEDAMRTQHHYCAIPAKESKPEYNHETNANWKTSYKITGLCSLQKC